MATSWWDRLPEFAISDQFLDDIKPNGNNSQMIIRYVVKLLKHIAKITFTSCQQMPIGFRDIQIHQPNLLSPAVSASLHWSEKCLKFSFRNEEKDLLISGEIYKLDNEVERLLCKAKSEQWPMTDLYSDTGDTVNGKDDCHPEDENFEFNLVAYLNAMLECSPEVACLPSGIDSILIDLEDVILLTPSLNRICFKDIGDGWSLDGEGKVAMHLPQTDGINLRPSPLASAIFNVDVVVPIIDTILWPHVESEEPHEVESEKPHEFECEEPYDVECEKRNEVESRKAKMASLLNMLNDIRSELAVNVKIHGQLKVRNHMNLNARNHMIKWIMITYMTYLCVQENDGGRYDLLIYKLQMNDCGVYICFAKDGIGRDVIIAYRLIIDTGGDLNRRCMSNGTCSDTNAMCICGGATEINCSCDNSWNGTNPVISSLNNNTLTVVLGCVTGGGVLILLINLFICYKYKPCHISKPCAKVRFKKRLEWCRCGKKSEPGHEDVLLRTTK